MIVLTRRIFWENKKVGAVRCIKSYNVKTAKKCDFGLILKKWSFWDGQKVPKRHNFAKLTTAYFFRPQIRVDTYFSEKRFLKLAHLVLGRTTNRLLKYQVDRCRFRYGLLSACLSGAPPLFWGGKLPPNSWPKG